VEVQSRDQTSIEDKDPDRVLLAPDDRADLVCLKLHDGKSRCPSIVEATTGTGGPFEPAINRIPGESLHSSDRRLIQPFDAESRDFIKGRAPVLESMIGCPGCRAERLPTHLALVATTLPPSGHVEPMANDGSGVAFSRWRTVLV